jgi:two-component system sensor histidine kinase KdpD
MAHGNIYPKEKVPAALTHFFRTDNLTALRELALRFVADETDENLVARLKARHLDDVWDVAERIVVAVDATTGTDGVIRRAARLAARARGELHVVHVTSSEQSRRDERALNELRRLADDLDAGWVEITGDDPAKALMQYAIDNQVTQIVLGSSRRSRLEELTRGSIVAKVIRLASNCDVDVHVIARRNLHLRQPGPSEEDD